MGEVSCFVNQSDCANPELPVYGQKELKILSRFRRTSDELIMEFVYTKNGWTPTWKMAREDLRHMVNRDVVDVSYLIQVIEGSVLKRVEKRNGATVTKLFTVTRWGLIDMLYDYERGVYVLRTGIKLEDARRFFGSTGRRN